MTPNITNCRSVLDVSSKSAEPSMTTICHGICVSRCLSDRDCVCVCVCVSVRESV